MEEKKYSERYVRFMDLFVVLEIMMNVERVTTLFVGGALFVAVTAIILPSQLVGLPVLGETLLEVVLWGTTVLFAASALLWVMLSYVLGAGYEPPASEYDGDEIQVRILTVDAADVVQATVDSLPEELTDRHVVAEEPLTVDGAEVHVVPDEFTSHAVGKGRAIEWARRTLDCNREFVLYLDEDSVVENFEGLPDADVVQLRERPRRTGSVLSYLADVYRMGVQIEQRAFTRLQIPLFAWGGGIAVRTDLENEVTWDRKTLVEDTAFVWAAAQQCNIDFALSASTCRNEAPPSLGEILQQRRRWAAGNIEATALLPWHYQLVTRVRNFAWALSPIVTVVAVPLAIVGVSVVHASLFLIASLGLAAFTVFWFVRGLLSYEVAELKWLLVLPFVPLVSIVHSMGTVIGILHPPASFRVTEKVGTGK